MTKIQLGNIEPLMDADLMPFGMHEGTRMEHVPASYLDWLHGQDLSSHLDVLGYIERNRDLIDKELEDEGRI